MRRWYITATNLMKKTIKIFMMFALVVSAIMLGSCSKDTNSPDNSALKNTTWKATVMDHEAMFKFAATTLSLIEKDLTTGQTATLNANYTFDGTTVNMTFTSFSGMQAGITLEQINAVQPRTATINGNQLTYINVVYTKQ